MADSFSRWSLVFIALSLRVASVALSVMLEAGIDCPALHVHASRYKRPRWRYRPRPSSRAYGVGLENQSGISSKVGKELTLAASASASTPLVLALGDAITARASA